MTFSETASSRTSSHMDKGEKRQHQLVGKRRRQEIMSALRAKEVGQWKLGRPWFLASNRDFNLKPPGG